MSKTPKSKGAAKELIEPEAPDKTEPIINEVTLEKPDKDPAKVIAETLSEIKAMVEEITPTSENQLDIEEAAEEAQPVSPEPAQAPDLRSLKTIYVALAPYSSAYKNLAAAQRKNDPSLAAGAVILNGMLFGPRKNYAVKDTPEIKKLMKDGMLISMTGSFRFRVREEPKAKEESGNADN